MITYAKKERARHWPVAAELMAQYRDESHTHKDKRGNLEWYQDGQLHRDLDKPAVIGGDGNLQWYQNGLWHRDGDKPSFMADGYLNWMQNGQLHRFGGPAVIYKDDTVAWVRYDENITQEVNAWLAGEEWQGTPEQIFKFQLRFL